MGTAVELGPIDLSCRDWEDRIRRRLSLIPPAAFKINPARARKAIAVFDMLRLPDVPGNPPLSEAAGEWFRELVGAFLGSVDRRTRRRLIRECLLLASKKSSKTSYGAALMLTALLLNERPRAEFLIVAPTQLISELAFDQAQGMIDLDDEGFLQKRLHYQSHLKQITNRRTGAQLRVKTFDLKVLTGIKPAGVLIDELHEVAKNAAAVRIIGQIRGGLLPYEEGFLLMISTQSDEPPQGAFALELLRARRIRDGEETGSLMPVLYEFPPSIVADKGDPPAWQNPQNWPMVCPNLGRSFTLERLVADFEETKNKGEAEIRRWASQHLNLEIGIALAMDRWEGTDYWESSTDDTLTLPSLVQRSEVIVVGIDGGGLDDLLGLTVLGRETGTKQWLSWSRAWAFEGVLKRRQSEAARFRDLEAAGELIIVDVLGDDIAQVADLIFELSQFGKFPIGDDGTDKPAIAVDPIGIGQLIDEIVARELPADLILGIPQGYRLSGAIKTTERKLADGTLVHARQALMNYCVGNAKREIRGSNTFITKEAAGRAKIDPLLALFDAVALMSMNPQAGGEAGVVFVGRNAGVEDDLGVG
jgi:phage terminase large subunit-like protein